MDNVYRIFQKGQEAKSGEVVTKLKIKSFITQPLQGEELGVGAIVILGAAYAGEADVERVEVSIDNGNSWAEVQFIGPHEKFAWRQWQYIWDAKEKGAYTLMSRAIDWRELTANECGLECTWVWKQWRQRARNYSACQIVLPE